MILVVIGTEKYPMNRVVEEVDRLAVAGRLDGEEVFIQAGACTYEPTACAWQAWLTFGEMYARVREARKVISHAGVGTFLLCRQLGTPQIMVPRRAARREHVDDHQLIFAQRLDALGLVRTVIEVDELAAALAANAQDADAVLDWHEHSMISSLRDLVERWGLT